MKSHLYLITQNIQIQTEEIGPGTAQCRLRVTPSRPATRTDARSVSYRALFPVPSSLSGGEENGGCRLQNASRFILINYIEFVFRKMRFVFISCRECEPQVRRNEQVRHNGET